MTDVVIPKAQAFNDARQAVEYARAQRDADRAAGRLPLSAETILRRLERAQRTAATASHRTAA